MLSTRPTDVDSRNQQLFQRINLEHAMVVSIVTDAPNLILYVKEQNLTLEDWAIKFCECYEQLVGVTKKLEKRHHGVVPTTWELAQDPVYLTYLPFKQIIFNLLMSALTNLFNLHLFIPHTKEDRLLHKLLELFEEQIINTEIIHQGSIDKFVEYYLILAKRGKELHTQQANRFQTLFFLGATQAEKIHDKILPPRLTEILSEDCMSMTGDVEWDSRRMRLFLTPRQEKLERIYAQGVAAPMQEKLQRLDALQLHEAYAATFAYEGNDLPYKFEEQYHENLINLENEYKEIYSTKYKKPFKQLTFQLATIQNALKMKQIQLAATLVADLPAKVRVNLGSYLHPNYVSALQEAMLDENYKRARVYGEAPRL